LAKAFRFPARAFDHLAIVAYTQCAIFEALMRRLYGIIITASNALASCCKIAYLLDVAQNGSGNWNGNGIGIGISAGCPLSCRLDNG